MATRRRSRRSGSSVHLFHRLGDYAPHRNRPTKTGASGRRKGVVTRVTAAGAATPAAATTATTKEAATGAVVVAAAAVVGAATMPAVATRPCPRQGRTNRRSVVPQLGGVLRAKVEARAAQMVVAVGHQVTQDLRGSERFAPRSSRGSSSYTRPTAVQMARIRTASRRR